MFLRGMLFDDEIEDDLFCEPVVDLTPVSGVDDKDGKPPIIYGINDAIISHTKPQHSLALYII